MQTSPAPQASRLLSRGKVGYLIVLISSAIAAFSFLVLPAVTVTFPFNPPNPYSTFSYQGPQSASLLQFAQAFGGNGALFGVPVNPSGNIYAPYSNGSLVIWSLLIFAVVSCIVSLLFTIRPFSRTVAGGISFIIMGTVSVTILGLLMLIVNAISSSIPVSLVTTGYSVSIGIGGWLSFLGMLATVIGGIVVIVTRPVANGSGTASVYPPQPLFSSYPQYPSQSPSPGYPSYPPQSSASNYSPPLSAPGYPSYPPQPSSPNYPPQS